MDHSTSQLETHAEGSQLCLVCLALPTQLFFASGQSTDVAEGLDLLFKRRYLVFDLDSLFLYPAVRRIRCIDEITTNLCLSDVLFCLLNSVLDGGDLSQLASQFLWGDVIRDSVISRIWLYLPLPW